MQRCLANKKWKGSDFPEQRHDILEILPLPFRTNTPIGSFATTHVIWLKESMTSAKPSQPLMFNPAMSIELFSFYLTGFSWFFGFFRTGGHRKT